VTDQDFLGKDSFWRIFYEKCDIGDFGRLAKIRRELIILDLLYGA
jgi:hypothetical protein